MKEKKPKKKKELTVTVANPKTKEEYEKMIDNLNKVFKIRYASNVDKKN